MTVRLDGELVRLEGRCGVEEAETLVGLLQSSGVRRADLDQCRHAHSAVVQALLAFGVTVAGSGGSDFLRHRVAPVLDAASAITLARQPHGEAVEHQSANRAQPRQVDGVDQ